MELLVCPGGYIVNVGITVRRGGISENNPKGEMRDMRKIADGEEEKQRIVVAATGASGVPVLAECLKIIREASSFESCLIMSDSAKITLKQETTYTVEEVYAYADHVFALEEIGAGPASGSYQTAGMLVVPCSMKTAAGIHAGYADNLILRAADVTIKEQRPLVLAVRETPLSVVHLRNLYELAMIPGIRIIPPMMTFYNRPESIDDMVYHIAARLVEPFGIRAEKYRRWNGLTEKEY